MVKSMTRVFLTEMKHSVTSCRTQEFDKDLRRLEKWCAMQIQTHKQALAQL